MKKIVGNINKSYSYHSEHKGAHYTFDNEHFMNSGEFMECMVKGILGYQPKKDANIPYDEDSDISELKASVKSSGFTLTNMPLADTFEDSIKKYFQTVHSIVWLYGIKIDEQIVIYEMDKNEFEDFLREFSNLNERHVIRAKKTSLKMITWFESRL